MKSDGRIKTDVYRVIKGSSLEAAVTGKLSKRGRSGKSDKEDIVISILDNGSGQIQEAFVNVNIYVPDIQDSATKEFIIHDTRVDELSELAIQLLETYNGGDFRFEIDKQRVLPVDGKNEHLINNKLLYMQSNG
ncbi:MAG: hypothetical protein LBK45_02920 [Tannerellaceae bacterium]|jgi:hypothetical protein|nr:hypothetical protein [Tannerellaceae bacterium]